jgi:CRP-like cAMP-binding protein
MLIRYWASRVFGETVCRYRSSANLAGAVWMANVLTRKLQNYSHLDNEDRRLLDEIVKVVRNVEAKNDIIREGDAPDYVHLILNGFACRYKHTVDGVRQIIAYLLPGDFCDLHVARGTDLIPCENIRSWIEGIDRLA